MNTLQTNSVEGKFFIMRDITVILDNDVAELFGVEAKEVKQAVKNNPDKFPEDCVFELTKEEKQEVIKNFDNPKIKFSPTLPTAFTEKGLYMLTTILKTPLATQATLSIIQAFTDLCKLSRLSMYLTETTDEKPISMEAQNELKELLQSILKKLDEI
jgi:hypothetical protein